MTYGLTGGESFLVRKKRKGDLLTILVSLVVITVLICAMFHITHTYADSLPIVHQNDYYCDLIKKTGEEVMGADATTLKSICN